MEIFLVPFTISQVTGSPSTGVPPSQVIVIVYCALESIATSTFFGLAAISSGSHGGADV
jgi:hypothetical protein